MNRLFIQAKNFFIEPRYRQIREVFWFVVITLVIHFSYRFWSNTLYYWPIHSWMNDLQQVLAVWVFNQSTWVDQHILNISLRVSDHTMYFANNSWISINASCTGDKQILQFALLMLIYPGLWKHKLWFIPLGMVIIHLTNLLRIILLSVVAINKPEWIDISHGTVLRGIVYVVIFVLWLVWVKIINHYEPEKSR